MTLPAGIGETALRQSVAESRSGLSVTAAHPGTGSVEDHT